MKTLIAVPCMDQVAAPFAHSLACLQRVGEVMVSFQMGSLIYDARNNFSKMAISKDVDYVLWLDSDMIFPEDLLAQMIKHMEDGKDIVTGLYFRRRAPFTPVLFKELEINEEGGHWKDFDDYPVNGDPFEVAGCGFGCCMVRKSVLVDVALNYQTWFTPFKNFGEDLAFAIRARELGYKIWCDPKIKCGHVGQLVVNEEVWIANKTDEGAPAKRDA